MLRWSLGQVKLDWQIQNRAASSYQAYRIVQYVISPTYPEVFTSQPVYTPCCTAKAGSVLVVGKAMSVDTFSCNVWANNWKCPSYEEDNSCVQTLGTTGINKRARIDTSFDRYKQEALVWLLLMCHAPGQEQPFYNKITGCQWMDGWQIPSCSHDQVSTRAIQVGSGNRFRNGIWKDMDNTWKIVCCSPQQH